jgi:hypothetical protein
MRIRALDVQATRVDGRPVGMRACTLAARTDAAGNPAWEASGWIRGVSPAAGRLAEGGVHAVALDTAEGTLAGKALVSLERVGGPHAAGTLLFLVGIGRLEPWPA